MHPRFAQPKNRAIDTNYIVANNAQHQTIQPSVILRQESLVV